MLLHTFNAQGCTQCILFKYSVVTYSKLCNMKCISIIHEQKNSFQFINENSLIAEVAFSPDTRVGRLKSTICRRLFLVDKTGVFSRNSCLRNEYGVKLGRLVPNKANQLGVIELENKKYNFSFSENELTVFGKTINQKLISCSFSNMVSVENALTKWNNSLVPNLILILSWHCLSNRMP
jgi:hypothetical protein